MATKPQTTHVVPHSANLSHRFAFSQLARDTVVCVRARPWLAVPFLAIPALLPFYLFGLGQSHDGDIHIMRLALLDYHLQHGILYPRWFPELRLGNGYPVLNYYSPLIYYLAEAWHLIGLSHSGALMVTLALLVVVAGWGAYWLASDLFGREHSSAALIAATAYMYAPYLLTNVFVRGAIAEVGAQALLPWILLSVRRLMRAEHPEAYVVTTVLSLSALPLTHNITLLLALPLLVLYAFISWWLGGRQAARLRWLGVAVALAMAATAFFWAPMVAQRSFLSDQAYQIARQISIRENVWRWNSFLNMTFLFGYRWAPPFQLGMVQLLIALAGFLLAGRRDVEWLFFALLTVAFSVLIGAWAVPLWQSSPIFLIVQFPWRLLSLLSLLMALLSGGIVLRIRSVRVMAGATGIVLALIVFSNLPRLNDMSSDLLPAYDGDSTLTQIAHSEMVDGITGSSDTVEFRPRWAATDNYEPEPGFGAAPLTVETMQGNAFAFKARVTSAAGGPLRFTSLYFPSFRVTLDDQIVLPTYPSTSLGLLTVDLPPGEHQISLVWARGMVERWATMLSLVSLAALTLLIWRQGRRWLFLLPLMLLLTGVGLFYKPTPLHAIHAPVQSVTSRDLQLVGYRAEQEKPGGLIIYPYWYVSSQPGQLHVRWQLRDSQGQVVNEIEQNPYFDSALASNWPPGTLVDDAYELPLPPGLPAGLYQLYAQLKTEDDTGMLRLVGPVELPRPVKARRERVPDYTVEGQFGNAHLVGYDMAVNGRRIRPAENVDRPVAVRPGDSLDYTLYWRATGPLERDYSARVEIVGPTRNGLVSNAHLVGAPLHPTALWDTYNLTPDHYRLVVPESAAPMLYEMQLRFYEPQPLQLVDFAASGGQVTGDYASLRPIKVANMRTYQPQYPLAVRVGEMATVLGYDIDQSGPVLRPGDQFTVTLYYRVENPVSVDYTRFLQFANPALGTVAQQDSYPAGGENPTHAWLPGETIADPARLTIAKDAQPGAYILAAGFYDLQADLARIPLHNSSGQSLPEKRFELGTIEIGQ